MKRFVLSVITISCLFIGNASAQITMLDQQKMNRWNVPAANYSGITPIGEGRYAVVSDKQDGDGFYEFEITQNDITGQVENIKVVAFHNNGGKQRDAEGIAYFPDRQTVFISAEDDQRIKEYSLDGTLTGRELAVPEQLQLASIHSNYGFEALTYSDKTGLFWTCTENTIKSDGDVSDDKNPVPAKIRLQSFDCNMKPASQFIYETDAPRANGEVKQMAFGIPELLALPDSSLLVLEREFLVAQGYLGSYVDNKIYRVNPTSQGKTLQAKWTTNLSIFSQTIANYEGMCLGAKLRDGRQTILLVSDSQGGYGNSLFHLKDYIRVGIIEDTSITTKKEAPQENKSDSIAIDTQEDEMLNMIFSNGKILIEKIMQENK